MVLVVLVALVPHVQVIWAAGVREFHGETGVEQRCKIHEFMLGVITLTRRMTDSFLLGGMTAEGADDWSIFPRADDRYVLSPVVCASAE